MQISLTGVQVIDLFFRFAAVGQLTLLFIFLLRSYKTIPFPQLSVVISMISYILLTAPIDDAHYGGLRHVLLLFTDLTPFVALWFVASKLDSNFSLPKLNKWILLPVSLWCLVLVYVFLVLGGKSILHDLNHGIGIAVLVAVIYLCLSEYFDDLDNQRRNTRLLVVAFCSFYMTGLVLFEFVLREVRDSWSFSLLNALFMLVIVSFISINVVYPNTRKVLPQNKISDKKVNKKLEELNALMANGAYQQQELTIGKLAEQLAIPEHQLRQMINQDLGFSNFSHYLNSYRIPWVCEQLRNSSDEALPILTLALEVGYGSIAPFNRAFKKQMGLTPTQYRDQF